MAGLIGEVRSTFRRPCYLSSQVDVDPPTKRRGSPEPYDGYPFTFNSGGSCFPDDRALSLDRESRSPRCIGLRKGRLNSPVAHAIPFKSESVRALQAFGMSNNSDLDLIERRRPCAATPREAHRPKIEVLHGLPLAGRGADISLMGGRRVQGLEMRGREVSPHAAKKGLEQTSIEYQFRRHQSCPPISGECSRKDEFKHALRAEQYADLLGRPEGYMRRTSRRTHHRSLSLYARRYIYNAQAAAGTSGDRSSIPDTPSDTPRLSEEAQNATTDEGQLIHVSEVLAPEQSADLIVPLQDATDDMPAGANWDAMLYSFVESPELAKATHTGVPVPPLSLPAKAGAGVATSAASTCLPSPVPSPPQCNRSILPLKKRSSPGPRDRRKGSPDGQCWRRGRMSRQSSGSDTSGTASTVDTQTGLPDWFSTFQPQAFGQDKQKSTRRNHIVAESLRDDKWKARRRAQWVG